MAATGAVISGIAGLIGAGSVAAQVFGPKPKAPSMPAPGQPAQTPTGSQTTAATGAGGPSFLAAAAAPPSMGSLGQKSLLGQ